MSLRAASGGKVSLSFLKFLVGKWSPVSGRGEGGRRGQVVGAFGRVGGDAAPHT